MCGAKRGLLALVGLLALPIFVWADLPAPAWLKVTAWREIEANLSWARVPGAEVYRILRQTPGRDWQELPDAVVGTSFQDTQLTSSTEYRYRVAAVNPEGAGPWSEVAAVVTKAPEVLQLRAQALDGEILITWKPSPGALGYQIYRHSLDQKTEPLRLRLEAPALDQYRDREVLPGTSYIYQVRPFTSWGETIGTDRAVVATTPGKAPAAPVNRPEPAPPAAPQLSVTGLHGAPVLSWTTPGGRWSVLRTGPEGQEQTLNAGLIGLVYTDLTAEDGKTYSYRIQALDSQGQGPFSEPVRVTVRKKPQRPWSGRLQFALAGEPEQNVALEIGDLDRPIRGVLLVEGRDLDAVPPLVAAAKDLGMAVVGLGNFNFGSGRVPQYIQYGMALPALTLDEQIPEISIRRLEALLATLARKFPEHPEFAWAPVASFGYSGAINHFTRVFAEAGWEPRVLAMVNFGGLDYPFLTLSDHVPHLFVSSEDRDVFSSLNMPEMNLPLYSLKRMGVPLPGTPMATYDQRSKALVTHRGAPLTVLVNRGARHGGNPDNPLIARWFTEVLCQRLPADPLVPPALASWKWALGWSAWYKVTPPVDTAVSRVLGQRLRLKDLRVGPADPASSEPYTWLPSRNFALEWQTYAATGQLPSRP